MTRARNIKSIADAQYYAERRLPRLLRDYYRAGTGARSTVAANTAAYDEVTFRPHVAVRWPDRDISTTVLGHTISMPLMIAPTGGGRLAHPDGERGGARAAGAVGTIQWVSTFAGTSIEDVMREASGPVFFQLYYPGSREGAEPLIARAKESGCSALVLTVDTAVPQRQEIPARGRVPIYRPAEPGLRPLIEYVRIARIFARRPAWTAAFLRDGAAGLKAPMVESNGKPASLFRASQILTRRTPIWEDISWIREKWDGPLVIKGVLRVDDAQRAARAGVDGIVVSNHGGNMLDGDPATLSVLPAIADAVGDKVEVYLDGGVRRGSDVVKAVALGARAVLIGRPWLWANAAAGSAGVLAMLESVKGQISDTVGGLGCPSIQALDRSYVSFPDSWLATSPERRGSGAEEVGPRER